MSEEETKKMVWEKAEEVEGKNKAEFRLDPCGAMIQWDKFRNREDEYGWEIDHVVPRAKLVEAKAPEEEIENSDNLRAMHWKNNDAKSSDYPEYRASVKYEGGKNIETDTVFAVNSALQKKLSAIFSKYEI